MSYSVKASRSPAERDKDVHRAVIKGTKRRKGFWERTAGSRGGEINPMENPGKSLGLFARISVAFCGAASSGYSWFRERKMGVCPPGHDVLCFGELVSLQKQRRFGVPVKVAVRVDGRTHV